VGEILVHVDYEISEQDFMDAQRLAVRKSSVRLIRWTRLVLPLFGLFLLVFLVISAVTQGFSDRFIPGFAISLMFLSIPLLSWRTQKKMYANSPSMHGTLSLDVNDEGIQFGGKTFSSKVSWSHFARFLEDNKAFVLYQQNQRIFNIVPKRNLSLEQVAAFRQYLESKLTAG